MRNYFITGGAGFIGSNYVHRLIQRGETVTVYDNLSRAGAPRNIAWLEETFGKDAFKLIRGDIRDADLLKESAKEADVIVHLAGQVAVTTSVVDPRSDFEANALGTFNALEAARLSEKNPIFVYSSTNKVYGGMDDVEIIEEATRWRYKDLVEGCSEAQPLDFHSPYGCCYSSDTDILTRSGWKKFYELTDDDQVLTYNMGAKIAEYQKPTAYFDYPYNGKMYVQHNRRLETCVTPNHKMLVSWDCNHNELERPRLLEAQKIKGKPMAYLLAADFCDGETKEYFKLPEVTVGKHKHYFPAREIPMNDWLRFLGSYLSDGHCHEATKTGNCTVSLTTYYRTQEAIDVMRAIGLSPVIDQHHVVATSRQLYEYVKQFGKRHSKYIPPEIKNLHPKHLRVLLQSLLDGDGDKNGKNTWRYTTVSCQLADDVQEIALKCGLAASVCVDPGGFYRVYMGTTRTVQCNLDMDRSEWIDYDGEVYCVEVPNSVVMVRQNGHAYFSGNSKGTGDQYVRDYARIYGLRSVVFRQSCIAGSQEITTPFGKKIISKLQKGDLIHSGWGWRRVKRVWQTGTKPVRRLTTMQGLSVSLTADHRVVRPHGLFTNRDFAYGDFLAVLPEMLHTPRWELVTDKVLDVNEYLTKVRSRTPDKRCWNEANQVATNLLPLTGDKLLALTEIVGWLFGDGHLGIHHRQSRQAPTYNVQFFGSDLELTEISDRMAWLNLPVSGIIRSDSRSEPPSGQIVDGYSARIQQQSVPIFTLFEMLGVPVGDKVRVEYSLPKWIQNGHRLVKRAFLRGFFGAELGKVQANSYLAPSFAQSKDITCLENGRAWMEQLRKLLTEFGIETSYFEGKPKAYKKGKTLQMIVRLLGGKSMLPCFAEIGYAFSPERSQRLNELLFWLNTNTTPEFYEEIVALRQADGLLLWDSLKSFEELDEEPVYDLEIDDKSHLFVAGGVQVSNCIYGPRQFGVEDQGWVAWFTIAAVIGKQITIYGDGKQVRDILHVNDLLNAYDAAIEKIDRAKGEVYNMGGGPRNILAVWAEFGPILERLLGRKIEVAHADWRPGDQRVFYADFSKAKRELGWEPKIDLEEGIEMLFEWVSANKDLFQ